MTTPPVSAPQQPGNDFASLASVRNRLRLSPRLLPDMFWTLIGNLSAALSGLLVFKIISRYVPAQEYGKASLVLGVVGLLSQFIAGPMILAHLRLYFEHARQGLGNLYAIAIHRLLLGMAVFMSVIYLALAFANHAISNPVYLSLAVPAILLLFTQTQLTGTLAFLEAEKRYRSLTFAFSLGKVLQVPFLILLVYLATDGPVSVVLSQALAAAAVVWIWRIKPSTPVDVQSPPQPNFSIREVAASAMRAFGLSLYLFSFFGWVMATSDRYIIGHYWTTKEVGIYAINYGLWSIPYLSLSSWLEGLVRSRIFERAEAQEWSIVRRILLNRLVLTFGLGTLLTAIIYIAGKRLALMIIGERYWHSEALMLLICAAHLLYITGGVFYNIFISAKRVATMAKIAFIASALNLALNIVLVPRLGIIGAAWSTLFPYLLYCLLMLGFGQKLLSGLQSNAPKLYSQEKA